MLFVTTLAATAAALVGEPQIAKVPTHYLKCSVEDTLTPAEQTPQIEALALENQIEGKIELKNIFQQDTKNIDIIAESSISGASLEIFDNLDDQDPNTYAGARSMRLVKEMKGEDKAMILSYIRTGVVDMSLRCWIDTKEGN